MGSGFVLAGFFFLINPDFFTLDIFPDLIGYLLIAHGLYRLSFLEERIGNARRWARFLALSSLIKFFSNGMVLTTVVESTRLAAVFIFAVIEGWMGFLFADNLFKGVQYLAVRQDSDISLKGIDVCSGFVKVFLILKSILAFLPTSLILFYPEVDADPELVENYASLRRTYMTTRTVILGLCMIAVLVLGVYTARVAVAYWKRVRSDGPFCERLRELYRVKVTDNPNALVRIHVSEAFSLFALAMLFLPDLYMDELNLLPGFLSVLLIYLGLRNLSKGVPVSKGLKGGTLALFVISLGTYVFRLEEVIRLDENFRNVFPASVAGTAVGVVSQLVLLISAAVMLLTVQRIAKQETEYRYWPYGLTAFVLCIGTLVTGFQSFAYPGRSGMIPAASIGLALLALYVQKKSMDEMCAEIEWKRI